jgi:hypothetical protein
VAACRSRRAHGAPDPLSGRQPAHRAAYANVRQLRCPIAATSRPRAVVAAGAADQQKGPLMAINKGTAAVQTIEQIESRAREIRRAERDAMRGLSEYLRELAVTLPPESKLPLHFARCVTFHAPGAWPNCGPNVPATTYTNTGDHRRVRTCGVCSRFVSNVVDCRFRRRGLLIRRSQVRVLPGAPRTPCKALSSRHADRSTNVERVPNVSRGTCSRGVEFSAVALSACARATPMDT